MKSDFINYKTQLISPQKGWLFLVIPNDVLGGIKRRVWIKGILNNKPLIATANPWKDNTHVITVNKEMRKQLELSENDEVELVFEISEKPLLDIKIPEDLQEALAINNKAGKVFGKLPPSHKKEYILYINEAKMLETRMERIEKTIEKLQNRTW